MSEIFQSGAWRGFYTYTGSTHRFWMNLRLEFCNGRLNGKGNDDIGVFTIVGRFESEDCNFKKHYESHTVCYCGWRNKSKGINGFWCSAKLNGNFEIHPVSGDSNQQGCNDHTN